MCIWTAQLRTQTVLFLPGKREHSSRVYACVEAEKNPGDVFTDRCNIGREMDRAECFSDGRCWRSATSGSFSAAALWLIDQLCLTATAADLIGWRRKPNPAPTPPPSQPHSSILLYLPLKKSSLIIVKFPWYYLKYFRSDRVTVIQEKLLKIKKKNIFIKL